MRTACKLVKYCNVTCQETHRPKHEKECKKHASEIEIFDEALFKQPRPNEDCPICFLRLPIFTSEMHYQACCGKLICLRCEYAEAIVRQVCPFCRATAATSDGIAFERLGKRVEAGDVQEMDTLGYHFFRGNGVAQDSDKALELWNRAAKLGCAMSHHNVAELYAYGEGVEKDTKKAKYHWEHGAMGGDVTARYNLGVFEGQAGNINRAMKHLMISARLGHDDSLKQIQNGYSYGHVTKDEFEKALRAHKESKDEMQSGQRDAARAKYSRSKYEL
ncbi:hypothetical protein ACHAXR_000949 [Thalassiosira sp. AJA248-18]